MKIVLNRVKQWWPAVLAGALFPLIGSAHVSAQQPKSNAAAGTVTALSPEANRFAILIAVDKYIDPNIYPLDDPTNDVYLVRDTLINYAGFSENNIITLTPGSDPNLVPTRANILKALSRVKYQVQPDTLLLFMFSGHGISAADGKAFLLPQDAALTGDSDLLSQTSLSIDAVRDAIAATKVKQAIALMDACRNDPKDSKGVGDNLMSDGFTNGFDFDGHNQSITASLVMYATSVGERAYVDKKRNLGYFTEAFVEGMKRTSSDGSGNISLTTLLDYIQNTVPARVTRDLPGSVQKPMYELSGFKATDLIISHKKDNSASGIKDPLIVSNLPIVSPPGPPIIITSPAAGSSSIDGVNVRDPRTLENKVLDFQTLFNQNQADELNLGTLGEAAFKRGNYDWTIKFLEQARRVQHSKVWMGQYPYLAASYLLGRNDKDRFEQTLNEMLQAMRVPNTFLSHGFAQNQCTTKLNTVYALIPGSEKPFVADILKQIGS